MIVDPDFPTHYKTRQLVDIMGDAAPMAVIALWCHCQSRKTDILDLTPGKCAAICCFTDPEYALLAALVEVGFLDDLGNGQYRAHDWAERNKQITSKWNNKRAISKQSQNKAVSKPKQNHNGVETAPIISNHIISNPIQSEGECEGESFGDLFDRRAREIAKLNPNWTPHVSSTVRRDVFDDEPSFASVTDADMDAIADFHANATDDKHCGSVGGYLRDLRGQADRAHAWKASKNGSSPTTNRHTPEQIAAAEARIAARGEPDF